MNHLIDFYKDNIVDWMDLAKDIAFVFGVSGVVKWLISRWNKRFLEKSKEISSDIYFRNKIEDELTEYVLKENNNGIKDISIRFIFWKNYPRNIEEDGYKQCLFFINLQKNSMPSGFIDNTGINICIHTSSFVSSSVYYNQEDVFFISGADCKYKGFTEIKNCRVVLHLPFSNIINCDFKEYIEYQPVFYTKYIYDNIRDLYDDKIIVRERDGNEYFYKEFSQKKMLKKYSWVRYNMLKIKLLLNKEII